MSISHAGPYRQSGADESTSERMVFGLKTRDPEVVRHVWMRYSPMVDRMVRRMLGPWHESEDLVQEVFLRLLRQITTLREPKALTAFIMAITTHVAQSEMRRDWIRRLLRKEQVLHAPVTTPCGPDDDARESLGRLYFHLSKLSAEDRIVFTLRFVEGMELKEMVPVLGLSLATIKRRLTHASGRLAHRVGKDPTLVHYVQKWSLGGMSK